jgi:hypothetical protein
MGSPEEEGVPLKAPEIGGGWIVEGSGRMKNYRKTIIYQPR